MICNSRDRRAVNWISRTGILCASLASLTLSGCAPGMMRPTVSANAKALWTQWAANEEAAEALRIEQAIKGSLTESGAIGRAFQGKIAESLGAQRTDIHQLQLDLNSLKSLRRETESVTSRTDTLEAETKARRRDIDQVGALVSGLKDETRQLATDMGGMGKQVQKIRARSDETVPRLAGLIQDVGQLKTDLHGLSVRLADD